MPANKHCAYALEHMETMETGESSSSGSPYRSNGKQSHLEPADTDYTQYPEDVSRTFQYCTVLDTDARARVL